MKGRRISRLVVVVVVAVVVVVVVGVVACNKIINILILFVNAHIDKRRNT